MNGQLLINNLFELISINFKNMSLDEAKQASYYLLQSCELKKDRGEFDLAVRIRINISKEMNVYLFNITRYSGLGELFYKKDITGVAKVNSDNSIYNISMIVDSCNEINNSARKYVTRENYFMKNGKLVRETLNCNKIEKHILVSNISSNESLLQYANNNFPDSSFSTPEENKYVLMYK